MTERGEVIAAHSPEGDALLIGAGRDNGHFCAYIFSAPGRWTFDFACALFGARSHGNRMTAKTTHRPYVLAAVMAAMFMIAIEATIVSTAMPRIVGQLGGLQLYSWVFSAFLLTQTATTVVFGKLSDLLGRKKVMLSGIAIFLFGSLLCGFAWSMPSMILFRLVQGVGAGAIQPIGMTIVGDLYSAHERGKIQGYLVERLGDLGGRRTAGGRFDNPALFLGVDILDEPADRRPGRRRFLGLPAREHRSSESRRSII